MAEKKKATIVIKKIDGGGAGAHGGSWKVAFADFMTAMMCFFLVMWLLNTTEEQKKAVARYFSGPSVIEQYLSAYGAELTLEKLFLDLVNEPLKPFQAFIHPADTTPDITALGMKKLVLAEIAKELGALAKNVDVTEDQISFDIPDNVLFENGTDKPTAPFLQIMEKLKTLTMGLEHSHVLVRSVLHQSVLNDLTQTERVAARRMEIIKTQVEGSLEHDTVDVKGEIAAPKDRLGPQDPKGFIRLRIKQREMLPDGSQRRKLEGSVERRRSDMSVYDDFVQRMSKASKRRQ